MIDFHCHLDLYRDPRGIARECAARGMYVLSVTTTPSAWKGTCAVAAGAPRIQTALGLHPQLARERKGELPLLRQLLVETRYVGEIGLDGSPEFKSHWADQVTVFNGVLEACQDAGGRVLSVHSRRAATAVLDQLQQHPGAGTAVLHWFSGSLRELSRAVALGCWFSVGPSMLASENGRKLATQMPRERILTESDGPFARIGGRPALPWEAGLAIAELGRLWGVKPDDVDRVLRENLGQISALFGHLSLEKET